MSQYVLGDAFSAQMETQAKDAAGKAAAGIFSAAGDAFVKTAGGMINAGSQAVLDTVAPKKKPPQRKPVSTPSTRVVQGTTNAAKGPSTIVILAGVAAIGAAFLLLK